MAKEFKVEHYYRHQLKATGGIVFTVGIDRAAFKPEIVGPILAKAAIEADKILNL